MNTLLALYSCLEFVLQFYVQKSFFVEVFEIRVGSRLAWINLCQFKEGAALSVPKYDSDATNKKRIKILVVAKMESLTINV